MIIIKVYIITKNRKMDKFRKCCLAATMQEQLSVSLLLLFSLLRLSLYFSFCFLISFLFTEEWSSTRPSLHWKFVYFRILCWLVSPRIVVCSCYQICYLSSLALSCPVLPGPVLSCPISVLSHPVLLYLGQSVLAKSWAGPDSHNEGSKYRLSGSSKAGRDYPRPWLSGCKPTAKSVEGKDNLRPQARTGTLKFIPFDY